MVFIFWWRKQWKRLEVADLNRWPDKPSVTLVLSFENLQITPGISILKASQDISYFFSWILLCLAIFLLQTRHNVLGNRSWVWSFVLVWWGAELCCDAAAGVRDFRFLKEALVLSPLLLLSCPKNSSSDGIWFLQLFPLSFALCRSPIVMGVSCGKQSAILGWPISSFRAFTKMLQKNPKEQFGHLNTIL